jgi:hypothetical protein
MKRSQSLLLFFIIFLIFPAAAHAQAWSGIISPTRAMDWTIAGIPSGLPDSSWPICTTIAAYSGSGATIQNALAACQTAHPTGGVVALGAGTFTLSSGIMFPLNTTGHLALRGQGASSTILNFTGSDCSRGGGFICAASGDGTYNGNSQAGSTPHVVTVTSGAAKGSTQIVLGSLNTIVVGSIVVLNQCDTGYTGTGLGAACTGTPNDNGGYFHCQAHWSATNVGCAIPTEGGVNSWRSGASEMEAALVTAINQGGCGATCVTLSKPIEQPDWGSDTQAVIIQVLPSVGVENMLLVDAKSSISTNDVGVIFNNTYRAWVSGVATTNMGRLGVHLSQSYGGLVKDSYFFGNPVNFGDNAGFRAVGGANNLIQNNICHKTRICLFGADAVAEQADIFAYNFAPATGNGSNPGVPLSWDDHGAGTSFSLIEGNVMIGYIEDGDHGNHLSQTSFRNLLTGWMSCANGQCGAGQTLVHGNGDGASAIRLFYGARYGNIIGNVLGTPGWSNSYKAFDAFNNGAIYVWGSGYGAEPTDALVNTTTMLWGNWDVVNNSTQWNNAEVPTAAPTYPNSVPASQTLPASFYLSSKPSWFGSIPWPAIGPDVTGGNVGQCTGTLNTPGHYSGLAATSSAQCTGTSLATAWAGHVNAIPAMNCYLNVMGGKPDGTGSILTFDAKTCYGLSTSSPPSSGLQPPTNLLDVVH